MAYTQLSPTAIPGKRYSFSAKTEAVPESGPHIGGPFTELSVIGLPGQRHSFAAKTEAAAPAGPHVGNFTALSVTATPGQIHSFVAKTPAAVLDAVPTGGRFSFKQQADAYPYPMKHHPQIIKDDMEIMEIISMILNSEVL